MPCAHYHPFHPHQLAETKVKLKLPNNAFVICPNQANHDFDCKIVRNSKAKMISIIPNQSIRMGRFLICFSLLGFLEAINEMANQSSAEIPPSMGWKCSGIFMRKGKEMKMFSRHPALKSPSKNLLTYLFSSSIFTPTHS